MTVEEASRNIGFEVLQAPVAGSACGRLSEHHTLACACRRLSWKGGRTADAEVFQNSVGPVLFAISLSLLLKTPHVRGLQALKLEKGIAGGKNPVARCSCRGAADHFIEFLQSPSRWVSMRLHYRNGTHSWHY